MGGGNLANQQVSFSKINVHWRGINCWGESYEWKIKRIPCKDCSNASWNLYRVHNKTRVAGRFVCLPSSNGRSIFCIRRWHSSRSTQNESFPSCFLLLFQTKQHSYENDFHCRFICMQTNLFSYQRSCTSTRFKNRNCGIKEIPVGPRSQNVINILNMFRFLKRINRTSNKKWRAKCFLWI